MVTGDALHTLASATDETCELHSLDRWIIARVQPRSERKAQAWLLRAGFESYYPRAKVYVFKPQNQLPSKTRHKRRQEVTWTERAAYPGYMLVRRFTGEFDLNRLFDLPGMGGICMIGRGAATLADHEVEILRLQEAAGHFNVYHSAAVEQRYHAQLAAEFARGLVGAAATKRWTGESTLVGRACSVDGVVNFYERLGRITRVVTAPPA